MRATAALSLAVVQACAGGSGGDEGAYPACADCIDEKCADLLAACDDDPDCLCVATCLGANGIPGVEGCLAECALDARPPGLSELEACVASACPDEEDECATPEDYVPPDLTVCAASGAGLGAGNLPDCAFDVALPFDPEAGVLQLVSSDGSLCVRVDRRDDGGGMLANTAWTLLAMRIGPLGEVALVDDPAALCWYASHHNFRDVAHVWTGTRHYDLRLDYDGPANVRTYALHVFEDGPLGDGCAPAPDGSACIEGPIELVPFEP